MSSKQSARDAQVLLPLPFFEPRPIGCSAYGRFHNVSWYRSSIDDAGEQPFHRSLAELLAGLAFHLTAVGGLGDVSRRGNTYKLQVLAKVLMPGIGLVP